MSTTSNLRPEMPDAAEEDAAQTSALQLQLAAVIVNRLIERNGGGETANLFWDEDSLEDEDEDKYVDPELWDSDADEVLPEAKEIEWNLYECN